jgi:hypothetical protein
VARVARVPGEQRDGHPAADHAEGVVTDQRVSPSACPRTAQRTAGAAIPSGPRTSCGLRHAGPLRAVVIVGRQENLLAPRSRSATECACQSGPLHHP